MSPIATVLPLQYTSHRQDPSHPARLALIFCRVPDAAHVISFGVVSDEELVIPPCSSTCAERALLQVHVVWGVAVILPNSDKAFWV
jgi:hypothetical protein